jgi:hypothetical protein
MKSNYVNFLETNRAIHFSHFFLGAGSNFKNWLLFLTLSLFGFSTVFGQCSGGTTNIPSSGTAVLNGVTITSSSTGSVSTFASAFTSCTATTSANSLYVGQSGAWTVTLTFSQPINDLIVVITATGQNANENFIFNADGNPATVTDLGSCFSTIVGNQILSGGGATVATGGGGFFQISGASSYTTLVINGSGGENGALMAVCAASVVPCNAGTAAPSF